jgi:hypothetical protein
MNYKEVRHMTDVQPKDTIHYPLDQMNDVSHNIHSHVQQSQSYGGHLQSLFAEVDCLPSDIGNYLAANWNVWNNRVQDQQSAYTDLATTISTGSQAIDGADHDAAHGFQRIENGE